MVSSPSLKLVSIPELRTVTVYFIADFRLLLWLEGIYHFCTEETFLWESSLLLRDDVSNVKIGGKLLVDKEEKVNMEIAICDFCHIICIEGKSWAHQRSQTNIIAFTFKCNLSKVNGFDGEI
ncbi:hypothetical protein LXL04_031498 [Taraxacum kok-saghyz]